MVKHEPGISNGLLMHVRGLQMTSGIAGKDPGKEQTALVCWKVCKNRPFKQRRIRLLTSFAAVSTTWS